MGHTQGASCDTLGERVPDLRVSGSFTHWENGSVAHLRILGAGASRLRNSHCYGVRRANNSGMKTIEISCERFFSTSWPPAGLTSTGVNAQIPTAFDSLHFEAIGLESEDECNQDVTPVNAQMVSNVVDGSVYRRLGQSINNRHCCHCSRRPTISTEVRNQAMHPED